MSELDHESVRRAATQVVQAGKRLRQTPLAARADWLVRALATLRDASSPLGLRVRNEVPGSSGLSREMVSWALETSLADATHEGFLSLARSATPPNPRARLAQAGQLCAVVLSGNVFTAAVRAVCVPLLFGWPVVAKASSHDSLFARVLGEALHEADPELGEAFRVLVFSADDEPLANALFEQADAVSVYGSDNTLNTIRGNLSATVSFMGHGHGLGAALVAAPALAHEERAREAAHALALDIAAYDQRGCLSPHAVWVERDGVIEARMFTMLLFRELDALRTRLPRGPLPMSDASAQLSWRAVSSLRGELLEGDGFALSYEESTPLRISPGHRNVQIITTQRLDEACERLAPLGVHLKCLGLAGISVDELAPRLPPRVAPRLCALGQMQVPPLDAIHDGLPAWDGLVRWVDG